MSTDLAANLRRMNAAPSLPADYRALSPQQRRQVREAYVAQQDGKCDYCGEPLTGDVRADLARRSINRRLFPKGFFDHPVHLHHSHDTGLTIGAVHAVCNAILWQYEGE